MGQEQKAESRNGKNLPFLSLLSLNLHCNYSASQQKSEGKSCRNKWGVCYEWSRELIVSLWCRCFLGDSELGYLLNTSWLISLSCLVFTLLYFVMVVVSDKSRRIGCAFCGDPDLCLSRSYGVDRTSLHPAGYDY